MIPLLERFFPELSDGLNVSDDFKRRVDRAIDEVKESLTVEQTARALGFTHDEWVYLCRVYQALIIMGGTPGDPRNQVHGMETAAHITTVLSKENSSD